MDDWALLGLLHTRSQSIFPLSIPQCHYWLGSSPISISPHVDPGKGVGLLDSLSDHDVTLAQLVAQLLSFPLGCAWARTVPGYSIFGVSLNPGPFSLKEHVVITVMATVGSSSAYAVRLLASAAEIRLF